MNNSFDPKKAALVLIDLQRGIVGNPLAPHSAADVLGNCGKLATALRSAGALVIRVRVNFGPNGSLALKQPIDQPMRSGALPPDFDELVTDIPIDPADVVITKHNWGAFYGTELDMTLRRRGLDTIVLAGVSTNIGVESTARDGFERGYSIILIEDAMSSMQAEGHAASVKFIFPRLGRVVSTDSVLSVLGSAGSA